MAADPLKVLLAGLQTKWEAESTLQDLNGLYLHEKPPDLSVGFPYYVAIPESSSLWGTSTQSRLWDHTVEIRAYHRTPEDAATAIAVVTGVFDPKAFTLTLSDSHTFIMARRLRAEFSNPGKEVEYGAARYRFMTSEPRT